MSDQMQKFLSEISLEQLNEADIAYSLIQFEASVKRLTYELNKLKEAGLSRSKHDLADLDAKIEQLYQLNRSL